MRICSKFPVVLEVACWLLASAWVARAAPAETSAALQAIQQAPDPSAVVAAFANGLAVDRNDPKLYEAYLGRMVDLGLPELAYHQAQTLTTLQSNNGLAWGVVAYVDARRGEMPEAIAAINLAGLNASNNTFVQRTAGEIVAWFDTKADKSKLSENAQVGLSKVRAVLGKESAFNQAYNTAKSAYLAQANTSQAPTQAAPSQFPYGNEQYGYAPQPQLQEEQVAPFDYAAALPPADYPPYYYDSGPAWVEPAPWSWWQPVGAFAGFDFFPFSSFVVFDNDAFFRHHSFRHDHDRSFRHEQGRFFSQDRAFHPGGVDMTFHDPNHAFFHRQGKTTFFGTTARPNPSLTQSARANFHSATAPASSGFATRNPTSGRLTDPTAMRSTIPSINSVPRSRAFTSGGTVPPQAQGMPSTSRGNSLVIPPRLSSPGIPRGSLAVPPAPPPSSFGMQWSAPMAPGLHGGALGPSLSGPASTTPPAAPPSTVPMSRGFSGGAVRGGGGSPGGEIHGAGHR